MEFYGYALTPLPLVADFNPDAKILYEKIGYMEIGIIPGLYREGITEYLMMKLRGEKRY